jgi:hypothetical protein
MLGLACRVLGLSPSSCVDLTTPLPHPTTTTTTNPCQAAGSSKRKRAAAEGSAAGAEESGQSGGLSDESGSSEEGTSGVKPKPPSTKKRANPRKPIHPMRSALDEGSTGSDAKKVGGALGGLWAGKERRGRGDVRGCGVHVTERGRGLQLADCLCCCQRGWW